MLTARQNFMEVIKGGNPERYVKQFEPFSIIMPSFFSDKSHMATEHYMIDDWGVYQAAIDNQPGLFPLHDMEHRVVKDIANWREYVKEPGDISGAQFWEGLQAKAEAVNREEQFVTFVVFPGMFERMHHLCEITELLAGLYEEPEAVKDLLERVVDWELRIAENACKWVKPDALFHHDDWGTKASTFMSLEMFEEFLLEPYKKVYGYYKDHGVEIIVHHSDSYGETLVPYMKEIGIDVWQGCLRETNDIAKLIDTYGGEISFMGGVETAHIDVPTWTQEAVVAEVNETLDEINRKKFFIPCQTSGLNMSCYPGVYEAIDAAIDARSAKDFA